MPLEPIQLPCSGSLNRFSYRRGCPSVLHSFSLCVPGSPCKFRSPLLHPAICIRTHVTCDPQLPHTNDFPGCVAVPAWADCQPGVRLTTAQCSGWLGSRGDLACSLFDLAREGGEPPDRSACHSACVISSAEPQPPWGAGWRGNAATRGGAAPHTVRLDTATTVISDEARQQPLPQRTAAARGCARPAGC